jgi:hypothetical protein
MYFNIGNQHLDMAARIQISEELFSKTVLLQVLRDQAFGVPAIQKFMSFGAISATQKWQWSGLISLLLRENFSESERQQPVYARLEEDLAASAVATEAQARSHLALDMSPSRPIQSYESGEFKRGRIFTSGDALLPTPYTSPLRFSMTPFSRTSKTYPCEAYDIFGTNYES